MKSRNVYGSAGTRPPQEFWPGVPADSVAALENVSTESLAAEIKERKRLGLWKPVNTRNGELAEAKEFLMEHATDVDYSTRISVRRLTDRVLKEIGCCKYIATLAISIDRKRRGLG